MDYEGGQYLPGQRRRTRFLAPAVPQLIDSTAVLIAASSQLRASGYGGAIVAQALLESAPSQLRATGLGDTTAFAWARLTSARSALSARAVTTGGALASAINLYGLWSQALELYGEDD